MEPARGRWSLIAGTVAFTAWAPPSLVGLPFAALTLAARPRAPAEWLAGGAVGLASVALLVSPAGDLLTGLVRAYIVLVTAAFLALTLVVRGGGDFFQRALRASLVAGVAALALARAAGGATAWEALHWEAMRQASTSMRFLAQRQPQLFIAFEPVVRFVSDTIPATLALQSVAGLALAWQWHQRVAAQPLGQALGPFREFRFGDHWVWALVAALTVWVVPLLAGLKTVALNLGIALGVLYLLRGVAIVIACAGALGVSPAALVIVAAISTVLAVPLLFLVPGLATLGVTDTWLEFRRRLKAAA
jgi:predicted membrane protein DUF2232